MLNFWLIFGFFEEKHKKSEMVFNFEIVRLYVIVPLTVVQKGCVKS